MLCWTAKAAESRYPPTPIPPYVPPYVVTYVGSSPAASTTTGSESPRVSPRTRMQGVGGAEDKTAVILSTKLSTVVTNRFGIRLEIPSGALDSEQGGEVNHSLDRPLISVRALHIIHNIYVYMYIYASLTRPSVDLGAP